MHKTANPSAVTSPFVIAPGEGQAIWYLDALLQIKAPAAATAGQLSIAEHLLPHRSSPPLHTHSREDEAWYVLEGSLTYQVGDQTLTAKAGSLIWGPRGIPHTFRVDSASAKLLTICTPGGFEHFFAAIGQPAPALTVPPLPDTPPDIQALVGHARDYGCEVVGPPLS
jgi:quercetin dioxygenase-like cupin family protein